MSRIPRIVAPEYPHHVIQRGNNKQAVFFDDEDRKFYLKLLNRYANECGCRVNAYCLMNNHIHLLLTPQEKNSLSKTMQKLSLRYTQHVNRKYERSGRLWECRFYSCVIDKDRYLWSACRYIERNPVRAKLVSDPVKYKWSSARINAGLERGEGFVEPIFKSYVERKRYIEFLHQVDDGDEIEKIRKSTSKGLPFGSDQFLKNIGKKLGVVIELRPRGRPPKKK